MRHRGTMADPAARNNTYRIFVAVTAGVAAVVLLITQITGGNGGETDLPEQTEEIRLEPVSYVPPDAFTEPTSQVPTTEEDTPTPEETPTVAAETPASGPGRFPVEPASSGGIRSASADTVGLFGGSLRYSSCARGRLVDFLEASPAKARAWVNALNTDPNLYWSGGNRLQPFQIRDYIFELTPVILRADTWVTNHGYAGGRATPIQSVLQAGTAVLVDAYGVPRVKCYCGNPLLPARRFRPVYRGQRWPGFDPGRVLVLTRSVTIIDTFVLTDMVTFAPIRRLAGTDGPEDVGGTGSPTVGPSPGITVPPDIDLGTGDVQVTLLWDNGADLDLHVTDPDGSEIYFGQSTSPSGGQIDQDDIAGCGSGGTHVENIFWPEGAAPSGEYEAFIVNYSGCGEAASFNLRVTVAGSVVYQDDGVIAENEPMTPVTFTA